MSAEAGSPGKVLPRSSEPEGESPPPGPPPSNRSRWRPPPGSAQRLSNVPSLASTSDYVQMVAFVTLALICDALMPDCSAASSPGPPVLNVKDEECHEDGSNHHDKHRHRKYE